MLAAYICPLTGGALYNTVELSAFSKIELRFLILFEDDAIGLLLRECRIISGQ